MSYAPTNPLEVPPYQIQNLVSTTTGNLGNGTPGSSICVCCAQALGPEIYVGCSNGELLRFSLETDSPNTLESYKLQSRQTLFHDKSIDEIVLIPSLSRALVLSDRQIHFYTLPSLDIVSIIKPIRHVVTLAVDYQHLQRPSASTSDSVLPADAVEFCVIKRSAIALYGLREKLFYQKEIPLPAGATIARRSGRFLCIADHQNYSMVDLEAASMFECLPLSQTPEPPPHPILPSITIITQNEFLLLSWTGAGTLGVIINGDGDPVRGTLQWPDYPLSVCLDYPYITTLLPNETIEIHSIETQAIVQVISAPASSPHGSPPRDPSTSHRGHLASCSSGYLVPSTQRSEKMKLVAVKLLRGPA